MKLLRWLRGPSCRCYDDSYDPESRFYEHDPRHVRPESLFALIWLAHQQFVQAVDPVTGPWRGACHTCGWRGDWMEFVAADWDADMHAQRAAFPG